MILKKTRNYFHTEILYNKSSLCRYMYSDIVTVRIYEKKKKKETAYFYVISPSCLCQATFRDS